MTGELHGVLVEYAKWYVERFGEIEPQWYLFPFGKPRPQDPSRPQTSLKTVWRNVRRKAQVEGRWHDNRHTFVTDLAEAGVWAIASSRSLPDTLPSRCFVVIRTSGCRPAARRLNNCQRATKTGMI